MIFAALVSILTMFICLVKAFFLIFYYKSTIFEIKSDITPRYIIVYGKALKRLIFDKKLILELLLSLALHKKY